MTATISLIDWTVYETDRGTRHFVGRNKHGKTRHFLVSKPIERFDADTRTGIDRNGQAWMLSGGNGGQHEARRSRTDEESAGPVLTHPNEKLIPCASMWTPNLPSSSTAT